MCSSLSRVAQLETSILQSWLSKMITAPSSNQSIPVAMDSSSLSNQTPTDDVIANDVAMEASPEELQKIQENRLLLQSITSYIVKDGSHVGEEVAKAILNALIPMGNQVIYKSIAVLLARGDAVSLWL